MSILTPIPPATPPLQRAFFSIPLVGWFARDVLFGDHDNIYYLLVILATIVVLSIKTWGMAALVLIYLALVPVVFVTLVIIASPYTKT